MLTHFVYLWSRNMKRLFAVKLCSSTTAALALKNGNKLWELRKVG